VDVDFFLLCCLVFFDLSTQPQPASKAATRLEHPMAGALLATLRHSLVLERDVHAAVAQARARAPRGGRRGRARMMVARAGV
jgi:hypothetical protein